eukprot:756768-Hanusia_phi.AAC.4
MPRSRFLRKGKEGAGAWEGRRRSRGVVVGEPRMRGRGGRRRKREKGLTVATGSKQSRACYVSPQPRQGCRYGMGAGVAGAGAPGDAAGGAEGRKER